MTPRQKIAMVVVSIFIFLFILNLVRKRKIREEYSWLWLLTSLGAFALVIQYDWLLYLTRLIGAKLPTTTLFLACFVFLLVLCVQFSVKISRLTTQMKNMVQENALLRARMDEMCRKE